MNKFHNSFNYNNFIHYPQIVPPLCKTPPSNLPAQKNYLGHNPDSNNFKKTFKTVPRKELEKSLEETYEKGPEKVIEEKTELRDITSKSSTRKHLTEKPLFEFHGIQLYSDDLLILLLIFFLYKENINDILLFVALFSLLF